MPNIIEIQLNCGIFEPIPKLLMNLNKFTPDNNSAGKMDEGQVIGGLLLETD